ncbi:hypothetical protein M758_6G196200 [Ceratodon purpureus]|nr:hypothetical protein M758_6G196200 [Ceratodon purpureus]
MSHRCRSQSSYLPELAFTKMALKLLALGLLVMVAFVAVEGEAEQEVEASNSFVERARKEKDNSFDYFFFVQQWPGSYCDAKGKKCCFPVTGDPGPYFGIHGLWPNRNDGSYPDTCTNEQFDSSELHDVVDNLNKNWGTLACKRGMSGDNEDFWDHEWAKHGTCSGFTQHQYFEASLNLYNDYDITAALAEAGIVPDDSFYPISQISKAFTNLLGFAPQIECNIDPEGNKQLYQVYICVAKDGKTLIKCPTAIRNPCQGSVQFPVFDSAAESDQRLADEL